MAHHKIEWDEECKECDGTGIYVGMGEGEGAGVVCHGCEGTGCEHKVYEYDDFKGKKRKEAVTWVIQANPGIGVCKTDAKGAQHPLSEFGGMSYKDWLAGKPFPPGSEMRNFVCPHWWAQAAGIYDVWDDDWCRPRGMRVGTSFSSCRSFGDKNVCWVKWDSLKKEG